MKPFAQNSFLGEEKSHYVLIKNYPSSWFIQQQCLQPDDQPPELSLAKEVKIRPSTIKKKNSSAWECGMFA